MTRAEPCEVRVETETRSVRAASNVRAHDQRHLYGRCVHSQCRSEPIVRCLKIDALKHNNFAAT